MLKRFARSLATTLVFGFAFAINPAYIAGCASSGTGENESDPEHDAAIKSALVEQLDELNGTGAWHFEYEGESYELLIELTQQEKPAAMASAHGASHFIATAHACGTRTFYQSASACITTNQLAVEGTLTLRRLGANPKTIVSDLALEGSVEDYRASFTFGEDGYLTFLHEKDAGPFAIERLMSSGLGSEKLMLTFERSDLQGA